MEVVENQQLDEGITLKDYKKKRSALKQKEKRAADKIAPGRRAGIHADKASPERAARHRANVDPDYDRDDEGDMYPGGKLKNPKKIRKAKALGELGEQTDIYDIILSHLLDEGYAETQEQAEVIMVNMSEEWRESIMEREQDEPGESDKNPEVRSHNRAVGYRVKPRRPRREDDPRYGTVRDRGGNWKY